MSINVSDFVWQRLQGWGINRVYGYPRDGVGGLDVALEKVKDSLQYIQVRHEDIFRQEDATNHLAGTTRMGDDSATSVVSTDCRSWDIPNLWICDDSIFPTTSAVNVADDHQHCDANGGSNPGAGRMQRAIGHGGDA